MATSTEAWQYWHDVLLAGGPTSIPRWTRRPVVGVAEHTATIDGGVVVETLQMLADETAVPRSTVLFAAHVKVLAALSGDREVATGYVAAGGRPLPCRLSAEAGSLLVAPAPCVTPRPNARAGAGHNRGHRPGDPAEPRRTRAAGPAGVTVGRDPVAGRPNALVLGTALFRSSRPP